MSSTLRPIPDPVPPTRLECGCRVDGGDWLFAAGRAVPSSDWDLVLVTSPLTSVQLDYIFTPRRLAAPVSQDVLAV